jgi:hypothetical protein
MKYTTIRITHARPVRVNADRWPILADADWYTQLGRAPGSGERCQANEVAYLRVRRHDDGRAIVYARRTSGPSGMPSGYRDTYAGRCLDASATEQDLVGAIVEVANLVDLAPLADDAIADLPPFDLPEDPAAPVAEAGYTGFGAAVASFLRSQAQWDATTLGGIGSIAAQYGITLTR